MGPGSFCVESGDLGRGPLLVSAHHQVMLAYIRGPHLVESRVLFLSSVSCVISVLITINQLTYIAPGLSGGSGYPCVCV